MALTRRARAHTRACGPRPTAAAQELNGEVVVVNGKGKAIGKAVTVAEIIKRTVPGLHQQNSIAMEASVDRWEAKDAAAQLDR